MQALRESCEDIICCPQAINQMTGEFAKCNMESKKACMQDPEMQKKITQCCLNQCPTRMSCSEKICGRSQNNSSYSDCIHQACDGSSDQDCIKNNQEACMKMAKDDCTRKYGDRIKECEATYQKDIQPCIEACNTQLQYGTMETFTLPVHNDLFYYVLWLYVVCILYRLSKLKHII